MILTFSSLGKKEFVQICLVVEDLDRTAAQYLAIFGFDIPHVVQAIDPNSNNRNAYLDKPVELHDKFVSFMMVNVSFELLQPLGDPSVCNDYLKQHGEGVHHANFNVPPTAAASAVFADHG